MNNNILLALENVSVSFDNWKTNILKDLSLLVNKWEIISIIWLNWSGKTTLLKVIAKIQEISSWNIVRNYKNLYYIPQKIDIDNSFPISIKDFFDIYNKKIDISELDKYLKLFSLEWFLDKKISSLSWGEFQKVLIISWLLSKPDLLLFDEPTSAVDILSEQIFYDMLNDIKNLFPDISIIIVSHNMNLVYKKSDKIICLHEDNFCCHWTPSELQNNKKVIEIFWDNLAYYEHNPHSKH